MNISETIRNSLSSQGAALVGFADLTSLSKEVRQNFDYGIVIALSYTKEAMQDNANGNAARYYSEFKRINKELPQLALHTANILTDAGFKALPKVQTMVVQDENYTTVLPHKTVATLSGVGWIGKCATLVTKEFGSAIRLTVVLTDAPLDCGIPVIHSRCDENCMVCKSVCPGQAVSGRNWYRGLEREAFFDAFACRPAARAHAKAALDIEETLCGLCISNCPFTRRALGY